MKQRKVNKYKQELHEILGVEDHQEQYGNARSLQTRMRINVPLAVGDAEERTTDCILRGIYTVLQTETMVNACNFAKWSCIWAAVAATVALIAAGAAWTTVWLMLKGA
jgi:hypothetical protein